MARDKFRLVPFGFIVLTSLVLLPLQAFSPKILDLDSSRIEIDLASLNQKSPKLQLNHGLQIAPGSAVDLDQALLYLNFEEVEAPLLKDQVGLYRILESNYTPSTDAQSGKRSAFFRFRNQKIRISTGSELWPLQNQDAFTISMWLRPRHFFRVSNVFRRIGYASGERKGIEILLEQDRLRLNLENVFSNGTPIRSIQVNERLQKNKWYHIAVSVNSRTGHAIFFLNGKEEGRLQLSANGRLPEIDFSGPEFAPIELGGDFLGQVDELMILQDSISSESDLDTSLYGRLNYNHNSGRGFIPVTEVVTPVYQLEKALSSLELHAKGEAKQGSSLRIWYRLSDSPFAENDQKIRWQRFTDFATVSQTNLADLKIDVSKKTRRQYLQLKIDWQSDPTGNITPVLYSISIQQSATQPPIRPTDLKIIPELSIDGKICLEWRINPEIEIEENGGYNIHVGVRPNEFEAVLAQFMGGESNNLMLIRRSNVADFPLTEPEKKVELVRPEFMREWKRSHIRVFVDNQLLSRSRFVNQYRRVLPYFEVDHPYYFAVSAYIDSQAPSKLSQATRTIFR